MTQTRLDVLTIGNAIVDLIAPVERSFLDSEGLIEGIMHKVDADRAAALYAMMPFGTWRMSGGTAANTAASVAALGGQSGFVGRIGQDELGTLFKTQLEMAGVRGMLSHDTSGAMTARSMIFISPGGERTMNTHFGACHQLSAEDLPADAAASAAITLFEGFLWDVIDAGPLSAMAVRAAHDHGGRTALALCDPQCVTRNRGAFLDLLQSGAIDYVFANSHELEALYETSDLETAIAAVAKDAKLAAITLGAKGAVAVCGGERVTVPAYPVHVVVDATGAGDAFAGGFLLGLARERSLQDALRLGCLAASEIIGHVGARPQADLTQLAASKGFSL